MVMAKLPVVTIGLPFYNAEATLLDAVRSVFAQTHQDWKLILMDDGSTDRSLELARSIRDPRVSVHSDGRNCRLAARLNQITQLATSEFIARMDADDLMSPMRLERQLEFLSVRPDVDLLSTGMYSLTDDYQPAGIRCAPENHLITPRGLMTGNAGIVHASIIGRRSWFSRNPYNEGLEKSQDTNLWVCAFSKGDLAVAFLPDPLYYYREDGNITKSKLLAAYRVGRYTILNDAKHRFSVPDRVHALSVNLGKSMAISFLSGIGRLDVVRRRRNVILIDSSKRERLILEINRIRLIELPLSEIKCRQAHVN